MTTYELGALLAALALLALSFTAARIAADTWLRYRNNPDRAHRAFLSGRWWS